VHVGLDEIPDGVLVADESGRIIQMNRPAARLIGCTVPDALGQPLADVLPLFDDHGRPWWRCTRPYEGLATRTGQPERALALPGGRILLVTARYVRARPLGPVIRVVVSLRSNSARERVDRDSSELIATVAHELRSPLTSVKGFTATLLEKWSRFTDAQRRLMLETVDADANRLTRLITELLDIARIDSGRLQLHRQVVHLPTAIERQLASLVAGGLPADLFKVTVVGELPETWLDPDKIDQVLGNLLENAVRHGAGGIEIVVEPWDDGVAVTVSDEGVGIPQELADRVFTKFWRGSRRHPGGTGLGLYIVKGMVEAHGGAVTVATAPSGGAAFRFSLPAGKPEFA
jgi:signal transduction histidine kinase